MISRTPTNHALLRSPFGPTDLAEEPYCLVVFGEIGGGECAEHRCARPSVPRGLV